MRIKIFWCIVLVTLVFVGVLIVLADIILIGGAVETLDAFGIILLTCIMLSITALYCLSVYSVVRRFLK